MTSITLILLTALLPMSPNDSSPTRVEETYADAERQATRVMNAGLPFVEKMLAEHSEFPPFGAVMLPTGKIQTLGALDEREEIPIEELYAQLIDGLRDGAVNGDYQVVATFALVELRHPEDGRIISAAHVALEHRDGYCVDVYYPTVMRGEILVLGEAFAGRRSGTFFPCN